MNRSPVLRLVRRSAACLVTAALCQLGREAVAERRGHAAPTYSATRVAAPLPHGELARSLATTIPGPPPTGPAALLRRTWAAPTTVIGLMLAVLGFGRWTWSSEHGTFIVSGARSPALAAAGFQANAVGHVVVARPDPVPARLLVHEVAHVRQAERLGPFTLPLYVWWLARHGYRNHPMERGARAATRAWLRENA